MRTLVISFFIMLIAVVANATDHLYDNIYDDAVIIKQKSVEYDGRGFLGLDGYFSAQQLVNNQQMENRITSVEDQLKQLIDLVGQINNKLGEVPNDGPPDDPTDNPDGDNPPSDGDDEEETPPVEPDEPTNGQPTELDISAYTIFSQKCSKCHGIEDSKGGLRLVDVDNEALFYQDLANRVKIYWRTNGVGLGDVQRMPPGNPLSDEEVTTLLKWSVELANKE